MCLSAFVLIGGPPHDKLAIEERDRAALSLCHCVKYSMWVSGHEFVSQDTPLQNKGACLKHDQSVHY